jgi:hypothetical protein
LRETKGIGHMADDRTPDSPDAELPTPEASPFFDSRAETPAPAEPAEPAPALEPPASPAVDLGDTTPHTPLPDELVDPQAAQPTQFFPPVEPQPIPPFDPEAAQHTQLVPSHPSPSSPFRPRRLFLRRCFRRSPPVRASSSSSRAVRPTFRPHR